MKLAAQQLNLKEHLDHSGNTVLYSATDMGNIENLSETFSLKLYHFFFFFCREFVRNIFIEKY